MSAFFVSKEVIDDVVSLALLTTSVTRSPDEANQLGRALWAMNAEALNQRYDMEECDAVGLAEMRDLAAGYVFSNDLTTLAQRAKSARCLIYQCAEGNVPDTPLFKALEALTDRVGEPEGYDKAEWGRA